MSPFFLGLDTSCYTTSLGFLDEKGSLIRDLRTMIRVKEGQRGLRQSEALFQHIKNIPSLIEKLEKGFLKDTAGIAVSSRPRRAAGSYMPVFLAGDTMGRSLAAGAGAFFVSSTHQEGHIMAGLWSCSLEWRDFWAFHVSGGTTEALRVQRGRDGSFEIQKAAESGDLSAGQFIDRIGVKLGLPFPAGEEMEKLARQAGESVSLPAAGNGARVSFSGPETRARHLLEQGVPPAVVARSVEECIARSLVKMGRHLFGATGVKVLFAGGVMANNRIRNWLLEEFGDLDLRFASPSLSSDNAVGLAEIARQGWMAAERRAGGGE